jgi:paraquat-inducible protein A
LSIGDACRVQYATRQWRKGVFHLRRIDAGTPMQTTPQAAATLETVACPECDLLQRIPLLGPGDQARCPRCRHLLVLAPRHPIDLPLALTVTALICFIMANTIPLMELSVLGLTASTTIIGGAVELWQQGAPISAAIVAFCAVIAPGLYILFMLTVLLAARRPPAPHWVGELLRLAQSMQAWSMNEVMLLGIMVALIKIAELATVDPGIGMFVVGALVVLFPAIMLTFDPREIWKRIEWIDDSVADAPDADATGIVQAAQ